MDYQYQQLYQPCENSHQDIIFQNLHQRCYNYFQDTPYIDATGLDGQYLYTFVLKLQKNTNFVYETIQYLFEQLYVLGKIDFHHCITYINPDGSYQNIIVLNFEYMNYGTELVDYIQNMIKTYGIYSNEYICSEYNETTSITFQLFYDKSLANYVQQNCLKVRPIHLPPQLDIPKHHNYSYTDNNYSYTDNNYNYSDNNYSYFDNNYRYTDNNYSSNYSYANLYRNRKPSYNAHSYTRRIPKKDAVTQTPKYGVDEECNKFKNKANQISSDEIHNALNLLNTLNTLNTLKVVVPKKYNTNNGIQLSDLDTYSKEGLKCETGCLKCEIGTNTESISYEEQRSPKENTKKKVKDITVMNRDNFTINLEKQFKKLASVNDLALLTDCLKKCKDISNIITDKIHNIESPEV